MQGQNRASAAFIRALQKRAFVPFPQGAPPPDPSMMGGMPLGGGMPMDPSMMGGAPPMDPSMMGGMPPGGAPPVDPASLGAMAGPPGSIQINPQELIDIINAAKGGGPSPDAASLAPAGAAPGGIPTKEAKPKKPGTQDILDAVNNIGTALGVGGPAPTGMEAQASLRVPVPCEIMKKMAVQSLVTLLNNATEMR